MTIQAYLDARSRFVKRELDRLLPAAKAKPSLIHEAMRYSVFNGGKRIRPILVIASAEACSGAAKDAVYPACAIELFHAYSLIHDDLPCLDNDAFRRGVPTCHRRFGEAYALLAGDALLTYGFQLLSRIENPRLSQALVRVISEAIGTSGMIGGQVVDKMMEKRRVDRKTLDYINANKTGKLIQASCVAGALAADASPRKLKAFAHFGQYLGLAFQLVDDIMDGNGYLKLIPAVQARKQARDLTEKAKKSIAFLGSKASRLFELADFMLKRES